MSDTDPKSSADLGYEATDVQVPVILKFGVVLVAMMIGSAFGAWLIFRILFADAKNADPKFSPLAVIETSDTRQGPRLIDNEPGDLKAVEDEEQKALKSYGWVDKDHGVVRIPIERAMDLVAKESAKAK